MARGISNFPRRRSSKVEKNNIVYAGFTGARNTGSFLPDEAIIMRRILCVVSRMEPWGFEPQILPCHGSVIPFHYGPALFQTLAVTVGVSSRFGALRARYMAIARCT